MCTQNLNDDCIISSIIYMLFNQEIKLRIMNYKIKNLNYSYKKII